jgi:hypothetical protein
VSQDPSANDANPETTPLSGQDSSLSSSSDKLKIQFEVLLASKIKAMEGELADTRRQLSETREQEVTLRYYACVHNSECNSYMYIFVL